MLYLVFLNQRKEKRTSIVFNPINIVLIIGVLGVYLFIEGISSRGVQFNLYRYDPDVNFDPNGWLSIVAPSLSSILLMFYGYFGFGFYYLSSYVTDVWFLSFGNFLAGIFPMGYQLLNGEGVQEIMETVVYIGVKWHPDFAVIVNNIGYIGLIILCFLLGIISKYISVIEYDKPIVVLTNYIILLQMISLPVGNFVFTSSANKLILVSLSIYWFWRIFINRRLIYKL